MDDRTAIAALKSKIEVTTGVADRLAFSISKANRLKLTPLSMDKLRHLSDDEMEVLDAYLFRYGSLVSNIQDAIFKSIGEVEGEAVSTMSNRDRTNLMERIGAVPSAGEFSSLAVVRNKLMHDYPEEAQKYLDRINFIATGAPTLVDVFVGIVKYSEKFGIHISMENFANIKGFNSGITPQA
ncbi:MAG: hypothetical protein ACHP7O_03830 [Burkholderiales bacterium]